MISAKNRVEDFLELVEDWGDNYTVVLDMCASQEDLRKVLYPREGEQEDPRKVLGPGFGEGEQEDPRKMPGPDFGEGEQEDLRKMPGPNFGEGEEGEEEQEEDLVKSADLVEEEEKSSDEI